jgi:tetratricopeptide (TPR) repeat protein
MGEAGVNDAFYNRLKEMSEKFEQDPIELALTMKTSGSSDLQRLLEVMALPHYFEKSMIDRIMHNIGMFFQSADSVEKGVALTKSLLELSFVSELPQAAGSSQDFPMYRIDKAYRSKLLEHWKIPERRGELEELSLIFRDYFRDQHKHANFFEGIILEREELYHNFIVDEKKALKEFEIQFQEGEDSFQLGICQALVNLVREQTQFFTDQDKTIVRSIDFYEGRLSLLQFRFPEAQQQFEALLRLQDLDWSLRVRTLAGLGEISTADGNWSTAIREYEASVVEFLKGCKNTGTFSKITRTLHVDKRRFFKEGICQENVNLENQLMIVRILTKMGDLALAMAQPVKSFAHADGSQNIRYVNTQSGELALANSIHKRLQAFAEQMYKQSLEILKNPGEGSSDNSLVAMKDSLVWKDSFGLATVLLMKNKQEDARDLYKQLLTDQINQHDRAEVLLALGDCYQSVNKNSEATKQYEEALNTLKNSWDRQVWAKTLLRLGRAKAIQRDWPAAISHLTESRQIYSDLHNEREEEKVQETFRTIARSTDFVMPTDTRLCIADLAISWPIQYFAYPASSSVLSKAKEMWRQVFTVISLSLALLYFLVVIAGGTWFLGLFGAESFINSWWAEIVLFIFCLLTAIIHVDLFGGFRRQVGKLLPLHSVYGAQPEFIALDESKFIHTDSEGQTRTIAWNEIKEIGRAHV